MAGAADPGKNLGGGIAPNGAYVVGKEKLINLIAERLTAPGEGKEVGPSLNMNKPILQGLFMAPSVVGSALKTAILTSYVLEELGYKKVYFGGVTMERSLKKTRITFITHGDGVCSNGCYQS